MITQIPWPFLTLWKNDITLGSLGIQHRSCRFSTGAVWQWCHHIAGLISHCPQCWLLLQFSLFHPPPLLHLSHAQHIPNVGSVLGPSFPSSCPETWAQLEIKTMQSYRLESHAFVVPRCRSSARKLPNPLFASLKLHYPAKYSPQPHALTRQTFSNFLMKIEAIREAPFHPLFFVIKFFVSMPSLPTVLFSTQALAYI